MTATIRRRRKRLANRCSVTGCDAPYYGASFCKKHHQWHWKRGLLPKPLALTPAEAIRAYSALDARTGCWLWQRAVNNRGYGTTLDRLHKRAYAHRVAYAELVGPIPDGLEVCHRCDTPACVNPAHLFLGTHQDNMRDSVRKGRARQTVRHGHEHSQAALTLEQVRYVRDTLKNDAALAAELNLSVQTIKRCRAYKSYRNVA